MADDLCPLVTPSLLNLLVDTVIPYPATAPLDFATVGRNFLGGDTALPAKVTDQVWPVLLALSKLGLRNIPDLTALLPPPTSPSFPRQALGLQLLLDQMPRRLCRGIHARWTNAYFDVISLQYAQTLLMLPDDEQPHAWARWKHVATLDYWVLVRAWSVAPLVHTERVAVQERALVFSEETRRVVEEVTATRDPYRVNREEILADVYGFPRVAAEGRPPVDVEGGEASVQGFAYWMCMLMDVHKPIVDRFGRYPYRNAFFGREDTPEETEWFESTGGFARPGAEVRERLRADLEKGVWTALERGERKEVLPRDD
ncbi:hypothetical protein B0T22DRAFT_378645 [Podospora appendiculata]|uniref:Uncharacterized protein n=1 Tax=Podospora appendiculata TaxID=314037 RepID=A0AAE0XB30_9PEZI|nr:hypothetical protein B0T22DRAFT_378645 [Podospora appendiculata]